MLNPAEHAQRVFGPVDARLDEDCRMQRRQAVLDPQRMGPVVLEGASINSAQSAGATLAVTEMQPCAPAAMRRAPSCLRLKVG